MTTPGTTMIEELEHACNSASVLAMYASRDGDENRAQIHREEATRLRRRAARVRELMAGPRGYLSIAQQLTGPIPAAGTAPTERKEP